MAGQPGKKPFRFKNGSSRTKDGAAAMRRRAEIPRDPEGSRGLGVGPVAGLSLFADLDHLVAAFGDGVHDRITERPALERMHADNRAARWRTDAVL